MKKSDVKGKIVSRRDQLRCILEKLGHQDEKDVSFITEPEVLNYHFTLDKAEASTKNADGMVKGLR